MGKKPSYEQLVMKSKKLEMTILKQKRARNALRHHVEELAAINSLTRAVTLNLSLEKVVAATHQQIQSALRPDMVVVYLKQDDNLVLQTNGQKGKRIQHDGHKVKRVGQCLCGLVAENGKPIYSFDIHTDYRCTLKECKNAGIRSFAALPLLIGEKNIGVLGIASLTNRHFSVDSDFLETIAGQIAIALHNSRLFEENQSHTVLLERRLKNQKKAEQALKESEEKYRNLIENMSHVIFATNVDKVITYVSPAVESIFEYTPAEVIGRKFTEFYLPEGLSHILEKRAKILAGQIETAEYKILTKSGKIRFVQAIGYPVVEENKIVGLQGIITDVTETKLLHEQLIQSERLAATGSLAASIAHEINSPLQGITALLNNIKKTRKGDVELTETIDLLKGAFGSIRDTVKNLLDLNRPRIGKKRAVNINTVIEDTLALVRAHLKMSKVNVHLELSADVPSIYASHQQLEQVFINLFNNAVEAIKGGSDKKALKRHAYSLGDITITSRLKGRKMVIEFCDTGPGIAVEDLAHIFDPFYSRKKARGIGIGLSISHRIIEDHGGILQADNLPAGGAVFTIVLPI